MLTKKYICPVCGNRTIPLWCKIFSGRLLSCTCNSCKRRIRLSPKQNGLLSVVFFVSFPVWIYIAMKLTSWLPVIAAFVLVAFIQVAFIKLEEKK